ncbi:MAG: NAD(P)-dependent oxidoreductase [Verrucomicrobiota bacterium]
MRAGTETLYGAGDNHDSFLLGGRTLGVVGCGNVGRALLPLLRPFASEILVHDPWIHPSILRELGVTPVSLEECFARSAAVFLLAATTTENSGTIGARHFANMAKGSLVVLVSRAGIVNFDELLDAAQTATSVPRSTSGRTNPSPRIIAPAARRTRSCRRIAPATFPKSGRGWASSSSTISSRFSRACRRNAASTRSGKR